jgi:hypothetical protein
MNNLSPSKRDLLAVLPVVIPSLAVLLVLGLMFV